MARGHSGSRSPRRQSRSRSRSRGGPTQNSTETDDAIYRGSTGGFQLKFEDRSTGPTLDRHVEGAERSTKAGWETRGVGFGQVKDDTQVWKPGCGWVEKDQLDAPIWKEGDFDPLGEIFREVHAKKDGEERARSPTPPPNPYRMRQPLPDQSSMFSDGATPQNNYGY